MNKPLSKDDFDAIERNLKITLEEDERYHRVNSVKCDAINTAETYEEFADRVAAAHLRPLVHSDYKKKSSRNWNQFATDKNGQDE